MSPITLDPLEISVPKPNISIFFTVTETPYALSKKLKLRLVREYRLIPTSLILRKGSNRSSTVWGLNESVLACTCFILQDSKWARFPVSHSPTKPFPKRWECSGNECFMTTDRLISLRNLS